MAMELMTRDSPAKGPGAKLGNVRAAYLLSAVVAGLAALLSAAGLAFQGVYSDKMWDKTWLGNDLVTLLVAVPVLVAALVLSYRGSVRGRMVWLGALYYMLYNYAFYVFGLPVTRLFVPLIAVFTLSGFALALGMFSVDVEAISRRFSSRTPAKPIAVYMWFVAAMVGWLWIFQWLKFLSSGKVPEVNGDPHAYQVIAAVDLSFMVSMLIPAAYLLWRRRPWGYVLGVMFFVQGAMYTAVMGTVCVVGWMAAPGSHLISGWFINCVVGCTASLLCLWGLLANVGGQETVEIS